MRQRCLARSPSTCSSCSWGSCTSGEGAIDRARDARRSGALRSASAQFAASRPLAWHPALPPPAARSLLLLPKDPQAQATGAASSSTGSNTSSAKPQQNGTMRGGAATRSNSFSRAGARGGGGGGGPLHPPVPPEAQKGGWDMLDKLAAFRAGCPLDWTSCCVFNLFRGRGPVVQQPPSWPLSCTATYHAAKQAEAAVPEDMVRRVPQTCAARAPAARLGPGAGQGTAARLCRPCAAAAAAPSMPPPPACRRWAPQVRTADYSRGGPHFLDWKALHEKGAQSMVAVPIHCGGKVGAGAGGQAAPGPRGGAGARCAPPRCSCRGAGAEAGRRAGAGGGGAVLGLVCGGRLCARGAHQGAGLRHRALHPAARVHHAAHGGGRQALLPWLRPRQGQGGRGAGGRGQGAGGRGQGAGGKGQGRRSSASRAVRSVTPPRPAAAPA
jgi:hypothetical protein